jgi:hypothetical protein
MINIKKHPFMNNIQSDSNEIKNLLIERKEKCFHSAKQIVSELEKCNSALRQIKDQPELYIDTYFDEMKFKIDSQAQTIVDQVRICQRELKNQLDFHQADCHSKSKKLTEAEKNLCTNMEVTLVESIKSAKSQLDAYSKTATASAANLNVSAINKIELDAFSMKQNFEKLIDSIKKSIFLNKAYIFKPNKEIESSVPLIYSLIGELKVGDLNQEQQKKLKSILKEDKLSKKYENKPKLIRLELAKQANSPAQRLSFSQGSTFKYS